MAQKQVRIGLALVVALLSTAKLASTCSNMSKKPTCADTIGILAPQGNPDVHAYELAGKIRTTVIDACVADTWSQDAIDCFAHASGTLDTIIASCESSLGPTASKSLYDRISALDSPQH